VTTNKPERPASPKQVTPQEAQDALEALSTGPVWGSTVPPRAFTVLEVAKQILGFDPSSGQLSVQYGGKTTAAYFSPYVSIGKLRKALQELVDNGVVTEIEGNSDRTVYFPYRTGPKGHTYVATARYEASATRLMARDRDETRKRILQEAERAYLDLHAKEIQADYEARCAAAGLDPDLEAGIQ